MRTFNKIVSALFISTAALSASTALAKLYSTPELVLQAEQQEQQQLKEYLVTFDMSAKAADVSKSEFMAAQQLKLAGDKLQVKKSFKHSGVMLVKASKKAIAELKANKSVLSVSENRIISDIAPIPRKESKATDSNQTKNTSAASWGLDRVNQRYLTLDGVYSAPRGGAGVTAYILDTGTINTSNEFDDANGQTRLRMGYNPFRDNFDSTDCHGHGSHVAGTVGGSTYGVAKEVNLVALRVMECGEVKTVANIVEGMEWVMDDVAAHQGPAVVNMSLSDPEGSVAWDNATQAMIDAGITVVVAAGNNYYDACINSPARLPDAITVGATDKYDNYNNLSNYGQCVDILAPGSSITSIDENGQSWTISGTSMAAPHVAGAAALVLERHPNFNHHQVKQYLLEHATQGVISGTAGAGDTAERSANKLLYVGDDVAGPLPQPVVDAGETVAVELLERGYAYYKTQVGDNAEQLSVEITSQDEVDLFVKYDDVPTANPVSFHNNCKQTGFGGNEVCEITNPDAGDWHILIASSNPNAAINLSVNSDGSGTGGGGGGGTGPCDTDPTSPACVCEINPNDPICNPDTGEVELINLSGLSSSSELVYQVDVPAGKTLTVATSGGTGDVEVLVNFGSQANSWWASDCYSTNSGNDDECVINQTQAGTYFIVLDIYRDFDGVSLVASYK